MIPNMAAGRVAQGTKKIVHNLQQVESQSSAQFPVGSDAADAIQISQRAATDEASGLDVQDPTREAQRQLLSYKQLKELALSHNSPFLGVIPEAFSKATKATDEEITEGLNWLAGMLVSPDGLKKLKPSFLKSLQSTFTASKNPVERLFQKNLIQVRPLDSGIAGSVYQVRVNGQDFAMKVFHADRSSMDAYRETATGLYYTQGRQTSDMSALFAANPSNAAEKWTLMEFIPPTANLAERAGKTLAQQRTKISDHNSKNLINGIRVDHGGVVTIEGEGFMSTDAFKRFSRLKQASGHKKSPSNVSVERPEKLASTQADWDTYDALCDNMPLATLIQMNRQGNMARRGRLADRETIPDARQDRQEADFVLPDTNTEGMLRAGAVARQKRRGLPE